MTIEELGRKIEENQHALVDAQTALSRKYEWNENDARLTVLNKCSSVLSSINLGYVFFSKYLTKEDWWRANSTLAIDREQMSNAGNEFEMFLRIGLIQNTLYAIESSFRIYVRAIDPMACSQGTAEFKNIYEWLLTRVRLQKYITLLDLWRNIRNSMHNNGLFWPTSRKDSLINYKDVIYTFEVGKPNDFVSTEFIVRLLPDIRMLLQELLESEEIVNPLEIKEIS